jgi:hypothetical protein
LEVCISTIDYGELQPSLGHEKRSFQDVQLSGRYARFGGAKLIRTKTTIKTTSAKSSAIFSSPFIPASPDAKQNSNYDQGEDCPRENTSLCHGHLRPSHVARHLQTKLLGTRSRSQIVSWG